jgi:phage tail sheath protein FI
MATTYKTPGVYIEEITKFPPSIAPVETAIPAFIGYTEIAEGDAPGDLNLKPTKIFSLVDYEKFFGGAQKEEKIVVKITEKQIGGAPPISKAIASVAEADRSKHLMYYALQMYFANGGGPCYIVSVGTYKALGTALVETELHAGLTVLEKADEPTLIICPEAINLSIGDFKAFQDAALAQCANLKDRFVIMDVHGGAISLSEPGTDMSTVTQNFNTAIDNFRNNGIGINNLKYGAAYAPNLETVLDFVVDETKIDVTFDTNGVVTGPDKLDTLKTANNRAYEQARAAIRDLPCKMTPSSTMAGVYATVDNSRGVWKAPANVSVTFIDQPTIQFSSAFQSGMNVDPVAGKSINAIRTFIGKGSIVWGARTLAGNDNEWRYISVRRFFIFVEESTKKATEQFVFEPNDANTWVRVQGMIENFLTVQWRQGALQGVKPEHAFYVAVGLGKTMTALDILEGRMNVEIGMAVVRPAEFIILKFSHMMAQS